MLILDDRRDVNEFLYRFGIILLFAFLQNLMSFSTMLPLLKTGRPRSNLSNGKKVEEH